jgi:hypothetical protein
MDQNSIPTAPTKLLSYQHIKRLFLFQLELLFQLSRRTIGPCVFDMIEEGGIYKENDKMANLLLPFL